MKPFIVKLDFLKAKNKNLFVDLKEYYQLYDNPKKPYTMMLNTPLLRNIDGFYILEKNIKELVSPRTMWVINLAEIMGKGVEYRWIK